MADTDQVHYAEDCHQTPYADFHAVSGSGSSGDWHDTAVTEYPAGGSATTASRRILTRPTVTVPRQCLNRRLWVHTLGAVNSDPFNREHEVDAEINFLSSNGAVVGSIPYKRLTQLGAGTPNLRGTLWPTPANWLPTPPSTVIYVPAPAVGSLCLSMEVSGTNGGWGWGLLAPVDVCIQCASIEVKVLRVRAMSLAVGTTFLVYLACLSTLHAPR